MKELDLEVGSVSVVVDSVLPPPLLHDLYHSLLPMDCLEELQVVEGVREVLKAEGENS